MPIVFSNRKGQPTSPRRNSGGGCRDNPLILADYGSYCDIVADRYEDAPDFDEDEAWRWDLLIKSTEDFYDKMLHEVDVVFVDGQPYGSAEEMAELVDETGVLEVSKDYNEHPIFTKLQNLKFRAVHDYIVHILGKSSFTRRGEIRAYNLHRRLAPRDTWPALFTEVAAQACYANSHGEFHPVQKIAILPGIDFYRVGNIEGYEVKDRKLQAPRRYPEREMFPPSYAPHARKNPAKKPDADTAIVMGESANGIEIVLVDAKKLRKMNKAQFEGKDQLLDGPVSAILGFIAYSPVLPGNYRDEYMEVELSAARKGWGPLLYELAMSASQDMGFKGLSPDQTVVSKEAERVWSRFMDRRDIHFEPVPRKESAYHGNADFLFNVFWLKKPKRLKTFTTRWKANRKALARKFGGEYAKHPGRIDDRILYTAFEMTDYKIEKEAWGRL